MLIYVQTSLLKSNAQVVVNTVNTVGVMGKGLAEAFRKRYPKMYSEYKKLCDEKKFHVGQLWLWKNADQWVLNFPTKQHWKNPSKLEYIEAGLKKFVEHYEGRGIREISFPKLGCGNGGLDWDKVRPLMEKYLSRLPIKIFIHDYEAEIGEPEHVVAQAAEFHNSFSKFLEDLRSAIKRNDMDFETLGTGAKFRASFNPEGELVIDRSNAKKRLSREDLFQVWGMLVRGPVSQTELIGKSHDEASYLLPLIAALPYVRTIKIRNPDEDYARSGVELLQSKSNVVNQAAFQLQAG